MTVLIDSNPRLRETPRTQTVTVAGIALPAHKLYAVIAALAVAVVALVVTGSIEVVAWSAAVTAIAVGVSTWYYGDQIAARLDAVAANRS